MTAEQLGGPPTSRRSLRQVIYCQLEPGAYHGTGLSVLNRAICILILASALVAILETEEALANSFSQLFWAMEVSFTAIFALEYAARLWVAAEDPRYSNGLLGRLRYMVSPAAMLDLLALAPTLLMLAGSETFLLRFARLIRIMRLARLGRFTAAIEHLQNAIRSRRFEFGVSICIAGFVLLLSSSLLYLAEGSIQPEQFGSIPRAMWWSIATLTTVGYGDVYPVTALGRLLAAMTAVAGIGIIAMPTGILAAAFSDAVQRSRQA